MEQRIINDKQNVEKMAHDIIRFLKRRRLWNTDCGLIYNGFHVQSSGITEKDEDLKGVMRIWYEGKMARLMDEDQAFFKALDTIILKYGYYLEPFSYCDSNIYPLGL